MSDAIFIFSEKETPRLRYVLDFLSEEFFGIEVQIIQGLERFKFAEGLKINYSDRDDLEGLQIIPHGLLFETEVKPFDFSTLENDTFSMIFFLLSRYEEYLPFNADKHGRFPAKESYLHKTKGLEQPMVDILALQLCEQLKEQHPKVQFRKRKFQFINTIDVDQAWKIKHHSLKRKIKYLGNRFLHFDVTGMIDFFEILSNRKKDPYFQFDFIKNLQEKYKFETIFFWQVGEFGQFDKNVSIQNKQFQQLIEETAEWSEYGLHPSYQSNRNPEILKREFEHLTRIVPVKKSRQHYIKLKFPETYQNLIKLGIIEDYSMGFADASGFRAGTSSAFFWYDLEQEKNTNLKIFPFYTMDVTLQRYEGLTNQESLQKLYNLIMTIKDVNGYFIPIFHTQNLSEEKNWKGWRQIYESMIEKMH